MFKPHPNLRSSAVKYGLFKSYEEYDKYLEKWDDLPNAKVVQDSGYLEYFCTSDAMIMDSVSFLVEYLYLRKPLLFLTRPEQMFLDIGNRVLDSYYKVPGEDYKGIEDFLQKVVISGEDDMKEQREKIFDEEFDYKKENGVLASDYICNDLFELLGERR